MNKNYEYSSVDELHFFFPLESEFRLWLMDLPWIPDSI